MVYYGLILGTNNLDGNDYVNFAAGGALEFPATLMAHVTIKYLGRRRVHAACLLICGVFLLALPVVPPGMYNMFTESYITHRTGWPNDLSIHLPCWWVVVFEPHGFEP